MDLTQLTQLFPGYKTYAAAFGLVVLAVFQARNGNLECAAQSLLAAMTAFGLRSALPAAKPPAEPPPPPDQGSGPQLA